MPGDSVAAWSLLAHKVTHATEVYPVAALTRQVETPGKVIDLTSFHTFQGFNVWTEQTSRQFGKPALRWLPLLGLFAIIGLAWFAARRWTANDLDAPRGGR